MKVSQFAAQNTHDRCTPHDDKRLLKIVFISPRPFGLMGTPGTYLLTEAYAKFADICVISNKTKSINTPIVYKDSTRANLYELEFAGAQFFEETEAIIKRFHPDLVIVGNYSKWFDIVSRLKPRFKNTSFVLDLKSPLILDESPALYRKIQEQGVKHSHLLDLVMTRCMEDVETWIPQCQIQVLQYPLGVKMEDYMPRNIQKNQIHCRRFVYVGAIHPRRELDVMIQYIAQLSSSLKKEVTFDFYGSGPGVKNLEKMVKDLELGDMVSLKGFVEAKSLAGVLSEYDAGIAWVPHNVYEHAPSLKLMEYLAAGLVPVAMDTRAHQVYAGKGFHIEFFSDSADTFGHAVKTLFEQGFSRRQRQENLKRIARYSWDKIASEKILPVFTALAGHHSAPPSEYASNIYERVLIWDLPVKPETPQPVFSSSLRVAAILGERLYRGLDPEIELLLLTPENWDHVLSYTRPDFLLMESTWVSVTDHWYMAQTVPGRENDEMHNIILAAKKRNIPTVFWMTLEHTYCPHFLKLAKTFDVVFCADPVAVKWFAKEGLSSKILLPAIQPVLYNPVHHVVENKPFKAGILFDGWVDLFQCPQIAEILKKIKTSDLNIFQTGMMLYKQQLQRSDSELIPHIRGTVMDIMLPILLKNAEMYLAFEKGIKTKTQQKWDILEAAACRVPVLYLGKLNKDDMLAPIVQCFEDEDAFCEFINHPRGEFLYQEKKRHTAWREIFLNHVFAKRMKTICNEINIAYDWEEFPGVSLVTGTMRSHLLPKCFEQFKAQTYPHKELILVFNGDEAEIETYRQKYAGNNQVHVDAIPPDATVGILLNYGVHRAKGRYFFRIDDDDHYGANYILDIMLHLRAFKAEIFGKRASFFHFEGEDEIYLRNRLLPSIKAFPADRLHKNQEYLISGCGFAGTVSFLKKFRFPDSIQASVDTALVERIAEQASDTKCLLVDNLNLVVERFSNVSDHTWRLDTKSIKKRSRVIACRFEDLIF